MVGENVKSMSVVNVVVPDRILNVITAILWVFFSIWRRHMVALPSLWECTDNLFEKLFPTILKSTQTCGNMLGEVYFAERRFTQLYTKYLLYSLKFGDRGLSCFMR